MKLSISQLSEDVKELKRALDGLKPPSPSAAGSPQVKLRCSPSTQAMRPATMHNLHVASGHPRHRPEWGSGSQANTTTAKDPNRLSGRNPDRVAQSQCAVENGSPAVGYNASACEGAGRVSVADEKECGRTQVHLGPGWMQPERPADADTAQQPLQTYAANFDDVHMRQGQQVATTTPGGPCVVRHGCGRVLSADGPARPVVRSPSFGAGRRTSPARVRSPHY